MARELFPVISEPDPLGGKSMQGPLRGIIAGVAAWKLGGGCISTILIFIVVYWLLGHGC